MATINNNVWRKYTNHFAWPTLFLALFILLGFGVSTVLAINYSHLWIYLGVWHTVLLYLSFSVAHEASHGNIHGSYKGWKWLNPALGWIFSGFFLVPFSVFRRIHLRHHGVTNNPHEDPDYWVAADKWWKVALRCLTIFFHYFSNLGGAILGESPKAICSWRANVIATLAIATMILVPYSLGYIYVFCVLWLIPVILSSAFLALVFDWLPHHPHQVQQRFMDSRIILFPGLNTLFLGHNYHLIHHLYPKIPFYHYKTCFEEIEDDLREKGAPISGLS